ncbi:Delta(24)-sterol reductase, partial [Lachnellula arida]
APYLYIPLTMDSHDRAVAHIATSVKIFSTRKEPFRIYHGSTNSTRKSQYERERMVDTSGLNHVLRVDTEKKTVLAEPNVPMDALVQATLQHGLLPPVVMEFPGITVGGGFAGTAGESSSFRYGFFDRIVNWIEMVLGDGQVVRASKTENSDLFFGAASSFGTLGVTTLLELQLIEAKSYVKLTYFPVSGISEAQKVIQEAAKDDSNDYLDGMMLAGDRGVICVGRLTNDKSGGKVQGFTRRSDPWFYLHVGRMMKNRSLPITEIVPIVDYLFRYDRGAFWVAAYAYKYFITPFNRITRWILDYFMHTRVMYVALHKSGLASQYIVQDVAIPYSKAEDFMQYLETEFKHYPIWLCPLKQSGRDIASTHSLQVEKTNRKMPEMMLNFGVWGPGPKRRDEFVWWNRAFERKVHELGGQKWLYAQAYYTEEEFNDIYNRKEYDALREKYHASYLPTVYDKVKVDIAKEEQAARESWAAWLAMLFWSIWPLAGLYGLYKTVRGGDYLLPRASKKTR